MIQYKTFIFTSVEFDEQKGEIRMHYSLDGDIHFVETIVLPKPEQRVIMQQPSEQSLFDLHLIGGVSYYKTCLPKIMDVRSGELTEQDAKFWKSTYENGLGEFFYKNDIDFRGLINFPSGADSGQRAANEKRETRNESTKKRVLVPIGGGKDSMVTVELLRKAGYDITLFRMGKHPFIEELANVAHVPLLTVDRKLSGELFKLNEQGALNGHVPITAYLSFLSIVIAQLYDFDAVVMSNERSANEGNIVDFHGMSINHQWSKSLEFEKALQEHLGSTGTNIDCFSLLRPLSELHIAKMFSQYPQYFQHTTSCNANWKIVKEKGKDRWCKKCPKCAFVFLILSAFLEKKTVESMFGGNMFADESLFPLYKQLLNAEGFKPFECVGTPDESKAAFLLAHKRGDFDDTPVMKMFLNEVMPSIKDSKKLIDECLMPSKEQVIPKVYEKIL